MGFLAGSFDKSVFNANSYKSAVGEGKNNGYAVVRIIPNSNRLLQTERDPSIKGVYDTSTGGLSFSIEANWAELGQIGSPVLPNQTALVKQAYEKINQIGNLAGASTLGAGLSSQLIYQKSGRLEIKVPIMIVDWNGIGQPIISSLLLSRYCLPSVIVGNEDIKNLGSSLEEGVDNIVKPFLSRVSTSQTHTEAQRTAATAALAAIEGTERVADFVGEKVNEAIDAVPGVRELERASRQNVGSLDDLYTLRSSPASVTIEIGQFFSNRDMVITGVDFEFSKEMTEAGPLFVKVNLSLKTRRILTDVKSIGLQPAQKGSRFLSVEGNTITESTASNAAGF